MAKTYWFYEQREGDETMRPLTLRALMTTDVHAVKESDLVLDAMTLMRDHDLRHVPVMEDTDGTLVGVVTESDVLRNVLHGHRMTKEEEYHATLDMMLPVTRIMTREVSSLPPDAPVGEAVALFLRQKIRCVPIMDPSEGLVGIVTETDLMKLLNHIVES